MVQRLINFVYNLLPWTWDSYHKMQVILPAARVYLSWWKCTFHPKPTPPLRSVHSLIRTPLWKTYPDSLVLILDDFNHSTLSKDLLKYTQHVKCATREGKTLDLCYSTISDAYRVVPCTPHGFSDHARVYLLPSYRQTLKRVKSCIWNIKRWDHESILHLQGCLACMDWDS